MKLDRLHLTLGVLLALGIAFRAVRERAPARRESSASGVVALDRHIGEVSARRKAGKQKPPAKGKKPSAGASLLLRPAEGMSLRAEYTPVGALAAPYPPSAPRSAHTVNRLLINLDVASAASIESLPRIGPALARRIVENRAALGPFGSLDGLDRVKGVGPALQKGIAPYVTFSSSGRPSTVAAVPPPAANAGRGKGRRRPPTSTVR